MMNGYEKNLYLTDCLDLLGRGTGDIGVYVTFEDKVTSGMVHEAREYGKVGNVDAIQILPMEDLVDRGIQYRVPSARSPLSDFIEEGSEVDEGSQG